MSFTSTIQIRPHTFRLAFTYETRRAFFTRDQKGLLDALAEKKAKQNDDGSYTFETFSSLLPTHKHLRQFFTKDDTWELTPIPGA